MLKVRRLASLTLIFALLPVVQILTSQSAWAECKSSTTTDKSAAAIAAGVAKTCSSGGGGDSGDTGRPSSGRMKDSNGPSAETSFRTWWKKADQVNKSNRDEVRRYSDCVASQPLNVLCDAPKLQDLPVRPPGGPYGAVAGPLGNTPPPEVVAYAAVARLRLTPPKPVIGPPPSINPWNMAAVGYPLWLSVDGNPNPPAATDRVYDLSVSIRARLSTVTFTMGDGKSVTCTDLTHVWRRHEVKPGAPSPTCGYTYTKPSLPAGKYSVTAYSTWSVDVTINGRVIPVTYRQQGTTTLPVGELQVTVR